MTNPAEGEGRLRGTKGRQAFRTISEVAEELDLPQHVLRFWESKFSQIRPLKRGGNRRYYRPDDVQVLQAIKQLLHNDGYTIRGVQNLFKAQGLKSTVGQATGQPLGDDVAADASVHAEMAEDAGADAGHDNPADSNVDALKSLLARLKAVRARL